MSASQTGMEGAVKRLTDPLHASGAVMTNGTFAGGQIYAADLRTLLVDHAALTAERDGWVRWADEKICEAQSAELKAVTENEALTARVAALEGALPTPAVMGRIVAACAVRSMLPAGSEERAERQDTFRAATKLANALAARQSREETGDRT